MKLAVSNIAWAASTETVARSILRQLDITGIEVAPTRLWENWDDASPISACEFRAAFSAGDFTVPALQAVLFGKPNLQLFGSDGDREQLKAHLIRVASLASSLGANNIVFGAPKNRLIGNLPLHLAFDMAREFFADIARSFVSQGVCLCLEANPPDYGCNFLTTTSEASRLTELINSEGIGLHLDTACISLAGEDICSTIERYIHLVRHFHVSEPFLADFSTPSIDHPAVAQCLERASYAGWASLEMRESHESIRELSSAATYLTRIYGGRN